MRTGQVGSFVSKAVSDMVRARDGGILGFYVNGDTQGVVGLYDVATTASAAGATASTTILASATCQLGWNFLPVAFTNGMYLSNSGGLPITFSLTN